MEQMEHRGMLIEAWQSPIWGHRVPFRIYEKDGEFSAEVHVIGNIFIHKFEEQPTRQKVEEHFRNNPGFISHYPKEE